MIVLEHRISEKYFWRKKIMKNISPMNFVSKSLILMAFFCVIVNPILIVRGFESYGGVFFVATVFSLGALISAYECRGSDND